MADPPLVHSSLQAWLDGKSLRPMHPRQDVVGLTVPKGKHPHRDHGNCVKVVRPARPEGTNQAQAQVVCGNPSCNEVVGTKVISFV